MLKSDNKNAKLIALKTTYFRINLKYLGKCRQKHKTNNQSEFV